MKDVIIRTMNNDDLPRVMEIEREVFSDPWQEVMFLQELEGQSAFLLEKREDKEVIGYICGIKILDEYMITNIAIRKEEQHRGFGKMLLSFLIKEMIKEGCQKCFLEVRASNQEAIDFYTGYGFEVLGKRKEYYHHPVEDALVMKLDLWLKE